MKKSIIPLISLSALGRWLDNLTPDKYQAPKVGSRCKKIRYSRGKNGAFGHKRPWVSFDSRVSNHQRVMMGRPK